MPLSSKSLPQAEADQLVALFNAGRMVELESRARRLIRKYPAAGFAWKLLGLAQHAQGKEALPALQMTARLLPLDAEAHSNLGAVLQYQGQLENAAVSFRRALTIQPEVTGLHFNLGAVLQQLGQLDQAVASFSRALELQPDHIEASLRLGNALLACGHLERAADSYRQALKFKPDYVEAHSNLGNVLLPLGAAEEAAASCRRALAINPDFAEAHINLGNALNSCGQSAEAMACYRRVLEIQPDSVLAYNNLGKVQEELGQLEEAAASYRRALEVDPGCAEAHFGLGSALEELGQLDKAVASYHRALEIRPVFFEAFVNLGHVFEGLGQFGEAAENYRRALEIQPGSVEALNNLGNAFLNLGQFDAAVASCRRALEIQPDFFEAHSNLGNALLNLGHFDTALASFLRAQELKVDSAEGHSNLLFLRNYLSVQTAPVLLIEARNFGDYAARKARPTMQWRNSPESNRCLRVGLVSGDLRNHPVGYFIEGMLAALASQFAGQLEVIAYASFVCDDEVTEQIKPHCHGWHSVTGLSDERLAQRVRDDGIDILVDLSGHTAHNRLPMFAWKPAPVQVSWLGYFATTGLAAMDYLLADPWTVPVAEEAHFVETVWRLPESYLCFTPPAVDVPVAPLPALTAGHITFGCFNNLAKMNDAVVALWARVLRAVPESRLFLKTRQLDEASVRLSVIQRFAAHGIDAGRLILEEGATRAELLAAYHRVDIALDPFPYPGGTTSVEAVWMGVPVLTLAGDRFLSHIGESILQNAGLPDWIAIDAEDYVARAAIHAGDRQRLALLRKALRQQVLASPLFDAPRFARHFETALRGMWTQWCNQLQEKLP